MSAMVTLGHVGSYEEAFQAVAPEQSVTYTPSDSAHAVYAEVGRRRRALYDALNEQGVGLQRSAGLTVP